VPLSEHEQRQLEQIEQALYADHPRLARAMRSKDPKVHYRRRVILAAAVFLAGIGLLAAGVVTRHLMFVAGGVVVMVLAGVGAVASYRRLAGIVTERSSRRGRKAPKASGGGMMERLEERWRRRQERGM
jgi:Protein of unknown function (DUF3040)